MEFFDQNLNTSKTHLKINFNYWIKSTKICWHNYNNIGTLSNFEYFVWHIILKTSKFSMAICHPTAFLVQNIDWDQDLNWDTECAVPISSLSPSAYTVITPCTNSLINQTLIYVQGIIVCSISACMEKNLVNLVPHFFPVLFVMAEKGSV